MAEPRAWRSLEDGEERGGGGGDAHVLGVWAHRCAEGSLLPIHTAVERVMARHALDQIMLLHEVAAALTCLENLRHRPSRAGTRTLGQAIGGSGAEREGAGERNQGEGERGGVPGCAGVPCCRSPSAPPLPPSPPAPLPR